MPEADLVLEGGGVKGLGTAGAVIGLLEAGYTFPRVAGTSVGAPRIVGASSRLIRVQVSLLMIASWASFPDRYEPAGRRT